LITYLFLELLRCEGGPDIILSDFVLGVDLIYLGMLELKETESTVGLVGLGGFFERLGWFLIRF
jgi:hypothetical protein